MQQPRNSMRRLRFAGTLTEKPFWLPTILLKEKITKGLDAFCAGLAQRPSS